MIAIPKTMRAVVYSDRLDVVEIPTPKPSQHEALIRVRCVGICNTDIEITKGYMGFSGVLGHEFVGEVVACNTTTWLGKRVVGEINAGCGLCADCRSGDSRHCAQRSTLGIFERNGALAQYLTLPTENLLEVPKTLDDSSAVFVEPLAAACEIVEQVHLQPGMRTLVLGDGKLGLLCAQVLQLHGCEVTVLGRHQRKLDIVSRLGIATHTQAANLSDLFDLVVEATGSAQGLQIAIKRIRPRGTVVLKSTYAGGIEIDLAPLVINEILLIGSRCGRFAPALRLLERRLVHVDKLLDSRFAFEHVLDAFARASQADALKVLVEF